MVSLLIVVGTRPEIIKMWPLISELKARRVPFYVLWTGQHSDLAELNFLEFGIQIDFKIVNVSRGSSLADNFGVMVSEISKLLQEHAFSMVLVHGDTMSAGAASVSAFLSKIPLGHVEAGLRTGDLYSPFPEEAIRRWVSISASYHFAPTEKAAVNLISEGVCPKKVFVTGNTVVDALYAILSGPPHSSYPEIIDVNGVEVENLDWSNVILVTCHRQENFGLGVAELCHVIARFIQKNQRAQILFPVHPNPMIFNPVIKALAGYENVHLVRPLNYNNFLRALSFCRFCVSDSGGLQEEAATLGVPLILYRNTTERPEIFDLPFVKMCAPGSGCLEADLSEFWDTTNSLCANTPRVPGASVFGSGDAAFAIVQQILKMDLGDG